MGVPEDQPPAVDSPAGTPPPPQGASPDPRLADCRQRIDQLDTQILALLSERGRVAAEIGKLKAAAGTPIYAADREAEILQRLRARNPGPFPDRVLAAIYRELMSGSFLLERPLRIAYLGPRGSFSHLAASGKFGASVEYEPVGDIPAIFDEVQREHVDFGVVPVENSYGGGIVDTLDAFYDRPVHICAEILRRIHHHLLARCPLEQITRLYSKPEVFEQCKQWLLETGLLSQAVPVASSSRAAELAAGEAGAGAIGSALAAELYGLPIQREHIEDSASNVTRFFVLGRQPAGPTGDDKTALMFAVTHQAGALVDVLDGFRAEGVNLSMITSRPSRRRNWEYFFFVDAEGHQADGPLSRAIAAIRPHCSYLSVLGSFPRAPEPF
jgi:chorismate mutase/prephenate dehydratase